MPLGENVVLAHGFVDGPGTLRAGFDDEDVAGLEVYRGLALEFDGAASGQQVAVLPRVIIDLPYAGGRLPDTRENFPVVRGM
jgi:hypothetical protein